MTKREPARSAKAERADRPHDITVRPFAFDFPDDLRPVWSPGKPVRSHMFNGFSLTMPYLEPYLIRTMREVSSQITDPGLLQDIRGFNGQEARHYECHRRLNELLKRNGYPELAEVDKRLAASYARLGKRSLRGSNLVLTRANNCDGRSVSNQTLVVRGLDFGQKFQLG